MTELIDLRSDTVTRPTPAMRRAMAEAEVGDAVIDVDPTVDRLEKMTAEILGKEAAVFVPSGSMANQIALRMHCEHGSGFLCEADCHIFQYEQGAFAALSGLIPQVVSGRGGVLAINDLEAQIHPEDHHAVRTRLVCIENTHNRWGGRVQPQSDVIEVCRWANSMGLHRHLDGARLWNAAIASEASEAELAGPFDSVNVCYSKGLGAPVGSALAGPAEFVERARRARKLFGGAMRQAGIIAAGAIHALQHHRPRLAEDHEHAKMLGEAIRQCEGLSIRGGRIDTNMVIFEIDPTLGTANQFVAELRQRGIDCFDISPFAVRLVTHLDVSRSQIDVACQVLRQCAERVPARG